MTTLVKVGAGVTLVEEVPVREGNDDSAASWMAARNIPFPSLLPPPPPTPTSEGGATFAMLSKGKHWKDYECTMKTIKDKEKD